MATSEIPGLLKYKDEYGNINLLLPITSKDNVDGIDEIEAELNETIKYTTQELNEAQKAQARANIGAMNGDDIPTVTEEDNDKSLLVQNGQWTPVPSMELRSYKLMEPATELEPAKYYVFGEVNSLYVKLGKCDDTLVSEYCFEFIAGENFEGLTIIPEPKWATPIQFVRGKTHQVSIMRGIGVMIRA